MRAGGALVGTVWLVVEMGSDYRIRLDKARLKSTMYISSFMQYLDVIFAALSEALLISPGRRLRSSLLSTG